MGRRRTARPAAVLRLDDGPGFGSHRQTVETFDSPAVQGGTPGLLPVEDRPFSDPQRSGIAPPFHQLPVALGSALERPHTTPAADPLSVPKPDQRIGIEPDPALRSVPMAIRRVAPGRDCGRNGVQGRARR